MNQPPGGFPPGGPGQPGAPQQPYPPTQAVPAAAKPFQATQLMQGAPGMPSNVQAQIAAAQAAQQQAAYGAPPPQQQAYGAPPAQQGFGAPPAQQGFGGPPPPQGFGAPPAQRGFGAPPQQQGFGAPPPQQGFGAPPMQQGFGGPPAQQGGFGGPPQQQGYGGPPPQAAPMQQAPPPGNGPAIGFTGQGAYGMPRIKVGGDFAPDKLWSALATGHGYERPRLMGLMMLGLSLVFTIGNSILIFGLHRYYPYLYGVAALFWWAGWWMVITGQPRLNADGTPCPLWARIGLGACLGIGALTGVAMCLVNWEAMLATAAINGAG
jgi:hypothetical protein